MKGGRKEEDEWLMEQADMNQQTLGATSTTECKLNVQKPIPEMDGITSQEDITSVSIN